MSQGHHVLNRDELRRILAARHSYYGKEQVNYEHVGATVPAICDVLTRALDGCTRVLDMGCGRGDTLVHNAGRIGLGIGIDEDAAHVALAQQNIRRSGAGNLTVIRAHARNLCFANASFDAVFSERGPLGHNDYNLAEAVRILRPRGRVFIETIGEWNHWQMKSHFEPGYAKPTSSLGCLGAEEERFARFGLRVEILASRIEALCFANLGEWLKYQCTVWNYLGQPLPSPDDLAPFEHFAADTTDSAGRVHLTYHTIWIGGSKA